MLNSSDVQAASRRCNIADSLREVAALQGEQVGLVHGTNGRYQEWTFGAIQAMSARYAGALTREGIQRGQRVMLMVRPSVEFICLTFALFQVGAVVILIDPGMGYANLLRCIAAVRPQALIGLPLAHLFSRIFPAPFATVRTRISVGPSWGIGGKSLARIAAGAQEGESCAPASAEDLAAIIFTTGSTGPPKGVCYSHGNFFAQLGLIRDYYGIAPGDVDQPCFPLFGLFSAALGAKTVIPDMDPAQPARVEPPRFIRSLFEQQVTYSFGSPAIWNVVSTYCLRHNIILPIKKILMAGAPVPGELVQRVQRIMAAGGEIHTPYGATESLPIVSISGTEIVAETWPQTVLGKGTCVGRALPGIEIEVIEPVEGPLARWEDTRRAEVGAIGEIVAKGPVVTRAYYNNEPENRLAKIADGDSFRHRLGDMGYVDEQGRLWFCGRKAHRVCTAHGVLYTIPCEAIFNVHPLVARSALVGVGERGQQRPVLIVEPKRPVSQPPLLLAELRALALRHELTKNIETFLLHPAFPVDIRHNAKIFREKLATWAAGQLGSSS